jgi:hypothetical protein
MQEINYVVCLLYNLCYIITMDYDKGDGVMSWFGSKIIWTLQGKPTTEDDLANLEELAGLYDEEALELIHIAIATGVGLMSLDGHHITDTDDTRWTALHVACGALTDGGLGSYRRPNFDIIDALLTSTLYALSFESLHYDPFNILLQNMRDPDSPSFHIPIKTLRLFIDNPPSINEELVWSEYQRVVDAAKKIQQKQRGNRGRITARAKGRSTKKMAEQDWPYMEQHLLEKDFTSDEVKGFYDTVYQAPVNTHYTEAQSKYDPEWVRRAQVYRDLSGKAWGDTWHGLTPDSGELLPTPPVGMAQERAPKPRPKKKQTKKNKTKNKTKNKKNKKKKKH